MIELFEQDLRTNDRQSSKGNQLKWKNGEIWYKADYTGYEGLAEYLISHLLACSTLKSEEYVIYDFEQIRYKSKIYNGTKSRHFLAGDWQIITLERLFKNFFGQSLYEMLWKIGTPEDRLTFLVEQVQRITGMRHFGEYMNKLFTIDAVFLNEDRHTHNIAVLMNADGKFTYCPVFDHGGSLLSDTTMDYPLGQDLYGLMGEVQAKTISPDFDEQLDVSEKLYGNNLGFTFTKQEVSRLLEQAEGYSAEEMQRVEDILFWQMRKYAYLFQKS